MNRNTFDPNNIRVKRARQRKIYNNSIVLALNFFLFIILLLGGGVLLYFRISLGWALIGFAAIFVMMIFWIKNALVDIVAGKSDNITDLISEDLLNLMDKDPTPAEIAEILPKTRSGAFLMARFLLPKQFFVDIAAMDAAPIEQIWNEARGVRAATGSDKVTGAVVAVAMIKTFPGHEAILKRMKLEMDDLYQGVVWFNSLYKIAEDTKKPVRSGGIARDFTFGYVPTLQRFAVNLSEGGMRMDVYSFGKEYKEIIDKMVTDLSNGGRKNAVLVGPYGSGRTTVVSALAAFLMDADAKIPSPIKFSQVYSLDAASLISATRNQGELESLMIRILNEIYSAKNIILCLDDAHLFFEEGTGSVDISNLLLPVLESGNIRMILNIDEQKFLEIATKKPALVNSFNKIVMPQADKFETIRILMNQAPIIEHQKNALLTYQALMESYRLSEQYIHDAAMPGKAKILLESAAGFAVDGLVTEDSVQAAVEKSYGVKVKVVNDSESREKLLNLEQLIHERMIDQVEAVSAVSNALRRAAAGVKNTNRPIGTFLFLGPTGVGKTELAKTLSEVYFDGEDNIIRLDMNEFVTAADVARLIKDGSEDALSLTAQVSKQPFAVILLDEIEKAHPAVLTTLLQLLDEGILRDEKNREISFRDTIVIATSNAGANEIREKISAGVRIEDFRDQLIDKLISDGEFKPEFLNRFDEICLFKPLSKEDLYQVLDLMIKSVNKTLEPQKIVVVLDNDAKAILVEKGYDPKMGARPMRRIVQKTVENIVAAAILSGKAGTGSTLHITSKEITIS